MTKRVELGRTGLAVFPIGLGANKISQANPETNTEYGGDIIKAALDAGMNFIDTAFIYGKGTSESIIGETLEKHGLRQGTVLATKGAHVLDQPGRRYSNHPDFLREQVHASLKRLRTDYIDLYYIHFPDEETPKAEAVGALLRLKEEGKIRAIGVSNFSLDQIKEGNVDGGIDVVQDEYNLLNRSAEMELLPYLREQEISFVPYFPFASGLLAGRYTKDTKLSENQLAKPQFQPGIYGDILERVEKLRPLEAKYGTGMQNVVLAYYLSKEGIDSVIPGARNRQQLLENREAGEISLAAEDIQLMETVFPTDFHEKLKKG